MSRRVRVIGAGSAGCHLAHACRNKGWAVDVVDVSEDALERMEVIYKERYGKWDGEIKRGKVEERPRREYDLVCVCTPPETHLELGLKVLEVIKPKVLLIEKPLTVPLVAKERIDLLIRRAECENTRVLVGYNHLLGPEVAMIKPRVEDGLEVFWQENVEYILKAHPWIPDLHSGYLGWVVRGGGSLFEHSHGVSMLVHLAGRAGWGWPVSVLSIVDCRGTYDDRAELFVQFWNGTKGRVVQDFLTKPARKMVKWVQDDLEVLTRIGAEVRVDDFRYEIEHVESCLEDETLVSPISLWHGIEVYWVLKAALRSYVLHREVRVDEIR